MDTLPREKPDEAEARRRAPPGLVVRARRPADAEGLALLFNLPGYRFGTMRLPFHSAEEVRGWIERASAADLHLIADIDGRIVGTASLQRLSGRQGHAGTLGVGVHDEWTRNGIGTLLLLALLDTADNWLGLRRLGLSVSVDNAVAIRLFRKFGFVLEGTHRAFALRDGRYVDAYTMARLAGPDPLALL